MGKWINVLGIGLLAAPLALAKPAVFRNSQLEISEAVVLAGESYQYFKHVHLQVLPSGQLALVNAEPRTLAQVRELAVAVFFTEPAEVELTVSGEFSDPCVELEPVSVTRDGNTYHVVLAETAPNPAATCLAQVVPYEISIPLDVAGLPLGNYRVLVNGDEIDFDLE